MVNSGWIRLHRKLMNNPLWFKEPFTPGQAWIDLLLLANHKPGVIWKRGIMVTVERGQVGYSERTLAARWRWSRNRVNRFLRDLKTMQQIEPTSEPQNKNVTSLISIVNYDLYQSNEATDEATDGTTEEPQKGHKRGQNKNEKNEKNEKNKTLYLEDVRLTDREYEKLIEKFGPDVTGKAIEFLNNYKLSKGKKYISDYHTILNWVVERVETVGSKQKDDEFLMVRP